MNKTFTQLNLSETEEVNIKTESLASPDSEPKQEVINNILNFSKALRITKSEHVKHIEIVIN